MKRIAVVAVTVLTLAAIATTVRALIVVPPGGGPHVRVFSGAGNEQSGFMAYDPQFNGGVSVAAGDVIGDSGVEIVTGSGPGMPPRVRVFSLGGALLAEFDAYASSFTSGVAVAVADGQIVTAPGFGGGPHVRVFNGNGAVQNEWMAYDPGFTGGVRVAAGRVGGSSTASIVTAPMFGGGPHVRVFNRNGAVQSEWMAYEPGFAGGVNVAAGLGRVVTAPWSGGGPHVRVFNGNGAVQSEWMAYDPGFAGGVQVAVGSVDDQEAVVTAAGPGGGPHVRVFDTSGAARGGGFFAYSPSYAGGVNVAVAGNAIVTGPGVPRVIEETLESGDAGPRVAALQQRLLDLGFWHSGVDGVFGHLTTQAVYAFQKANGLPRDGDVGPEDRPALASATRPAPASTSGDLIEVDLTRQLFFVVRNGGVLWAFNTSTGSNEYYYYEGRRYLADTPKGRFTFNRQIDGYRTSHLGTLYRPKYFTTEGHAIHGSSSVPPRPVSHGCVRVSNPAIDFIWAADLAPLRSTIWIYQ